MKIKQVCEQSGLTEKTVRFYIQQELVHPKVENGVHRNSYTFSEKDIEELRKIAVLRRAGFSLSDIRAVQEKPELLPALLDEKVCLLSIEKQKNQNILEALSRLEPWERGDVCRLADALEPMVRTPEVPDLPRTHRLRNVILLTVILLAVFATEYMRIGSVTNIYLVFSLCGIALGGISVFIAGRYAGCSKRAKKFLKHGVGRIAEVVLDTGFEAAFARAGANSAGTREPRIGGIWQILFMFYNELRPDCWYPVIQYEDKGKPTAGTFPYGCMKNTWKIGDEIEIAWNPKHPERLLPLQAPWLKKKAAAYLCAGIAIIGLSLIYLVHVCSSGML